MLIIRAARLDDLRGIENCAMKSGLGMTHLPKSHDILQKKIEESIEAFSKKIDQPINENYFFVLVDSSTNEIGGTCSICSRAGIEGEPFYVYQIHKRPPLPNNLPLPKENRFLQLKIYTNGPTELCALYLLPEFRKGGLGKLLSLSRFLFIASHQHRFTKMLIANMRGIIEKKYCQFWEGLGHHLVDISFEEVMAKRTVSESILEDIIPNHPLYLSLLSPTVVSSIGQTHPHTLPAFKMLCNQGFKFIQEIDPIDGGPIISAEVQSIHAIRNSVLGRVENIVSSLVLSESYIICNPDINFRACYGTVKSSPDQLVTISADVAKALEIKIGDQIRYYFYQ